MRDKEGFLKQARDKLLAHSSESNSNKSLLVIADIFRRDEERKVNRQLEEYFSIQDAPEVTINVVKAINKQKDRRLAFLANSSHQEILSEVCCQASAIAKGPNKDIKQRLNVPCLIRGSRKSPFDEVKQDMIYKIYILKRKDAERN